MPPRKEIVYPSFLECCQYANNPFWQNVFKDLAYGKPPYGTYISKDSCLCCSYKKKEFAYKIERKDPQVIHDEVYHLLTTKLGLLSQTERAEKRQAFQLMEKETRDMMQSWSSIRKKNIKNLLIEQYVIRMKEKHNLTIRQARSLLSVISVALVFKAITNKDIEYEDGKIERIHGISFSDGNVSLDREIHDSEIISSHELTASKKSFSDLWDKYLKELRKVGT